MEHKHWHAHYDHNVPTTIRYPRSPAQNLFQFAVGTHPDKPYTNFYGTECMFLNGFGQIMTKAKR